MAASVAWALVLPLAALVAGRPHTSGMSTVFALAVYGVGSVICHQLPERSSRVFGAQLPVCARCTGIYVGAAVSAVVTALFHTTDAVRHNRPAEAIARPDPRVTHATTAARGLDPARLSQRHLRVALLAAALPTAATLLFEWTTGITPSNTIRFVAGLPIGAAVAWAVVRHADEDGFARPEPVEG